MSDPLKGLGDLASTWAPKNRQFGHHVGSQAVKHWGEDGYSPTTSSSRSLSLVQQSVSAKLYASFSSAPADQAAKETAASSANKPEKSNEFSPENVVKRILSHVGNYLEKLQKNGASDERISSVLDSAKSGIEQGLADAQDKLEALGWLNDSVQQGIDETKSLLDEGMDALGEVFLKPQETQAISGAVSSSFQYRREDYSQIQLTTQEGDVVSVNLYALQAQAQGESAEVNEDGISYSRYESSEHSFAFDYSVEGDLNEDELAAIQEMMQSAGKVSDLFFDGDVAGALKKGLEMGFDTSQLASFSMSLQTSQSMKSSQAVSAYGQNSGIRSIQEPLAEYRDALEEMSQKAAQIFDDYRSVVDSVMSDILTMREEQAQKMDDMQEVFAYQNELLGRIQQWFETNGPDRNGIDRDIGAATEAEGQEGASESDADAVDENEPTQ